MSSRVAPRGCASRRGIPAATAVLLTACIGGAASAGAARAQGPGTAPPPSAPAPGRGDIRGTVVDSAAGAPIARASVSVRRVDDSALVAGAIATAQGTFRIQGLRPGRYRVRATAVGFAPRAQEVTLTEATERVTLLPIALARGATTLSGVQVQGQQQAAMLEAAADRNVYRPQALAPSATSAVDVLDALPGVQVDPTDGTISFRGSPSVAVQINGRPAPIRGPQLAAYLKSLPARIVDKIEVIPNPSAKNDPDGMAGIINVVLKQQTDLGLSGGVTTSYGGTDRGTAAGNVGYQEGRWTTFLSYGYTADAHAPYGDTERSLWGGGGQLLALSSQNVFGDNRLTGQNLSGTADYKLGAGDVLSTALAAGWRSTRAQWTNAFSTAAGAGSTETALQDAFARSRDGSARGSTLDASTTFKHAFGGAFNPRQPHEISAEVRVTRNRDLDAITLYDTPLAGGITALSSGSSRTNLTLNDGDLRQHEFVAQADYTHALTARRKIEAGVKLDDSRIDHGFQDALDTAGTGVFVPGSLANAMRFTEQVDAVYGVYSDGVGRFDLQAGLRGETARRAVTLGAVGTGPHNYGSLFPSASVVFNQSDANTFKLSYDRRLNRPGAAELNPFPTYTDNQNVVFGNPGLTPEYVNSFEAGFTRGGPRGVVELSPFYRNSTHDLRTVVDPNVVIDGREFTTITWRNLAHNTWYGTDLNATRKFGTRFNVLAAGTAFRLVTNDEGHSAYGVDSRALIARLNATMQVNPTLSLQGGYFYRSPLNVEGGRFLSSQAANFSVRQAVPGDRGTVSLRLVDPFNTTRFLVQVTGDSVTQRSFRRQDVRAVYVGYQYNFGRAPKVRVLRPDGPQASPFG